MNRIQRIIEEDETSLSFICLKAHFFGDLDYDLGGYDLPEEVKNDVKTLTFEEFLTKHSPFNDITFITEGELAYSDDCDPIRVYEFMFEGQAYRLESFHDSWNDDDGYLDVSDLKTGHFVDVVVKRFVADE